MKIVFMGTPHIAAQCLAEIVSKHKVCGVFTREDKPVGRKQILTPTPVKVVALTHNIPVFQPKNFKDCRFVDELKQLNPELIVVVAYGRILPKEVLEIPKYGCINLHVSLLPKYRGAAPIQHAVINGDKTTGITVMQMNEGIDEGDIFETFQIDIDENDTSEDVFTKSAQKGAKALLKVIDDIAKNEAFRTPQDDAKATFAPMLAKEMALFAFSDDAEILHNKIRGMYPWPVAYFLCDNKKIKVIKSRKQNGSGICGEILSIKPLVVACKQGALELVTVLPEASKEMAAEQWAAGKRFKIGDLII